MNQEEQRANRYLRRLRLKDSLRRPFSIAVTLISIRLEHRKAFSLHRKTLKLGEKIFKDDSVGWDESDDFSKIIVTFIPKGMHRMRSTRLLCKKGLAKDAVSILRSMFEDVVDFRYMYADKKRVQDFIDYDHKIRLKLGKILLRSGADNIDKERITKRNKELQANWDKVKSRFTFVARNGRQQIYPRWSCKSLRLVAGEIELEDTYDFLYGYLSNFIHSTPISGDDYVLGKRVDKNGISVTVAIGTSRDLVGEVLYTTAALFHDMIRIVNDENKMKFGSELDNIAEQLRPKVEGVKIKPTADKGNDRA